MNPQSERDQQSDAHARFAGSRHEHGDWSAVEPATAKKLEELSRFWTDLDLLEDDPVLQQMRDDARARMSRRRNRAPRWRWGLALSGVAACCAAVVIVMAGGHDGQRPAPSQAAHLKVYTNGRAAPREVRLADGTTITLDAATSLRMDTWNSTVRSVTLTEGRAFFVVRHDARRPFRVNVKHGAIIDLGTRFEVMTDEGHSSVSLTEGRVRIEGPHNGRRIDMQPGQRADFVANSWQLNGTAEPADWRMGVIRFKGVPAETAVAQLNRYLAEPLALSPQRDPDTLVSGTFRLDDPDGIRNALSSWGIVRPDRPAPTVD